jgi:hypothetical protein
VSIACTTRASSMSECFRRSSSRSVRSHRHPPSRGLGLGAVIVRELVQHGGTVRVETDDARGTTFRRSRAMRGGRGACYPRRTPRHASSLDDDPDIRTSWPRRCVTGYGVDTATNGREAPRACGKDRRFRR